MNNKKSDLRILKTRKAIKEALLKLIDKKGYERITIQDIANEAMINRNTFYLHYTDKIDLLDKLLAESMEKLNVCLNVKSQSKEELNQEILKSILVKTFEIIESDILFFKTMLKTNSKNNFTTLLKDSLKKFIVDGIGEKYSSDMDITLEYMSSGLTGVICTWILNNEKLNVDYVIDQVSKLNLYLVSDLLMKNSDI